MYKRFWALLTALVCLAGGALAQPTPQERLDAAFEKYSTCGACVVVIQNGDITWTHCYGSAGRGEPVTEDTAFQVGSISKMITGIGLMQLLGENNIPLDTELGDVLGYPVRHPQYPDTPVTLRQLMTHTASLRDSGDYDLALAGRPLALETLFTTRAAYTFLDNQEPGLRRSYSNLGGGIAGSLIEKLSGQTLDAYMTEHVFAPLGVTAAYQPALMPESTPLADLFHMPGHLLAKRLRDDASIQTASDPEHHYWLTAGRLIISAPDLARLLIALCDGGLYGGRRILRESAVSQITASQDHIGSVACETGHGLFLNIIEDDQVQGRTLYGHGGKANGMLCAAYFDPADRTGVVMLTNGCQNRSVHNGVGMLGRVVLSLCYEWVIGDGHVAEDPFAVE